MTLFLGSSRVALGLDAAHVSTPTRTAFNFGMPGAGPYMMDVYWDRLSADGVTPDEVVIEVMHPFYNAAAPRMLDYLFLDGPRLNVSEARALMGYGTASPVPLRRLGVARLFPAGRHGTEIGQQLGIAGPDVRRDTGEFPLLPDAHGYRPLAVPPERFDAMTRLAHQQYDQFYPDFAPHADAANRLRGLIAKAQAGGAIVTLLLTPEGSQFRRMMSPTMAAAVNDLTAGLAAEFHVDVIDARDWLPDGAFYDQHHLLPAGGRAFAEQLNPRLR